MNGLVYAVGGFNGSLRVRTVDVYDPIKDMWSSVASMEARRSTLGAAILNGMIYAVGGFDGSSGVTLTWRFFNCVCFVSIILEIQFRLVICTFVLLSVFEWSFTLHTVR